ncbi:MAG: hypothetical protein KZQ87_12750 [Candidatus Thiodiazotropha sp. (ex Cardiolucina cf. quadrata)]|nr:hypothetical protein [Candidatus Thiodiazotropha sp. (ex Cardiolucina cf. quadrata)]
MKTKTPSELSVSPTNEGNSENKRSSNNARKMAYKSVLIAIVIGIIAVTLLWLMVLRPESRWEPEAPVTETDNQVPKDVETASLPRVQTNEAYDSIGHRLELIANRIDLGFGEQHVHRSTVESELSSVAQRIQVIRTAIPELADSNKALGKDIGEVISQLDSLTKDVRAIKVNKPKSVVKRKSRPARIPPFQIESIDRWDDMTFIAVSQAGRVAFLKDGDRQSGWSVTRIDRLKGKVDLKGPAGQVYSVSLQR